MSASENESTQGSPRGIVGALALAAGCAGGYFAVGVAGAKAFEPAPAAMVKPAVALSAPVASASAPPERPKAPPVERTGFIDRTGKWAIAAEYAQARPFAEGLARVTVGDRWGFIDEQGKTVVPPSFVEADDFSDGMALVKNEQHKAGYIDRTGKLAIEYEFDVAWPFKGGVALVGVGPEDDRKFRLIRKNGDTTAKPPWEPLGNFSDGLAPVRVSDTMIGLLDTSGHVVVRVRLDSVREFSNGMAVAMLHGKTCAMNKDWRVVIAPTFDSMTDFSEGVAGAAQEGRHGFVNKVGRFVIAPTYDDAGRFSEGFAAVALSGRYGYVDHAGQVVIEPKFEEARPFSHGVAAVRVGGKFGYVDPQGQWAIEPRFTHAEDFGAQGLAAASMMTDEKDPKPSAGEVRPATSPSSSAVPPSSAQ
jgi:hypothetical protein